MDAENNTTNVVQHQSDTLNFIPTVRLYARGIEKMRGVRNEQDILLERFCSGSNNNNGCLDFRIGDTVFHKQEMNNMKQMYFAVRLDKITKHNEYVALTEMERIELFEWFDDNREMLRAKTKALIKREKNIDAEISKDELAMVPNINPYTFEREILVYKGIIAESKGVSK